MAKAAKSAKGGAPQTGAFKPGKTGRYVICPWSNSGHGLFAKQVLRSDKGNLWFRCVCGFRGYAPKDASLPTMTREAAIKAGALIPDEMI